MDEETIARAIAGGRRSARRVVRARNKELKDRDVERTIPEASRVAPEWHGWLHHTWQEPPTARPFARKPWEKPHQANLTGTDAAYRPPGSILGQPRPPAADYEAWSPE